MDGCLLLGHITKTSARGTEEASIAGPWDLDKYISTVSFVKLPTTLLLQPQLIFH